MATGQFLFNNFVYAKNVKHSFEIVAMACTYLASKIEEAPRRIRDVINVFHHLRQIRAKKTPTSLILDQNYKKNRNLVIKAEMHVLKALGFCVQVKHPYKFIVMYLQVLECEKNQTLMQTAWNYLNDSLRTNVSVRFPPETIACACIYLAARVLQIPLPTEPHWYLLFDATAEEIKEISVTTLRLYTREKPNWEHLAPTTGAGSSAATGAGSSHREHREGESSRSYNGGRERSRSHGGRERSRSHGGRERSRSHGGRERSRSHGGRERSRSH